MKVFELRPGDSPRAWGSAHGEQFREMIQELADIRLGLCIDVGGFASRAEVTDLAERHLPVLERFDADLYAELMGIAEGSGLDPALVVVLNHYTDLRDLGPATVGSEDDCSALFVRASDGAVLLGQTWDMHGSAAPYVTMLHVPRGDRPAAWLLSVTGCLGMVGLSDSGVGVTINNLKSTDARVGVVWPAVVRRALCEPTSEAARDVIAQAPLGSGHHYITASPEAVFALETSGELREVVYDGTAPHFVHTNHCLDPRVAARTVVTPESTTHLRHEALTVGLQSPVRDRADLWQRLGSHEGYPRSVCSHQAGPEAPHAMLTCAGVVMDLGRRDMWAAAGCLHYARPLVLDFP